MARGRAFFMGWSPSHELRYALVLSSLACACATEFTDVPPSSGTAASTGVDDAIDFGLGEPATTPPDDDTPAPATSDNSPTVVDDSTNTPDPSMGDPVDMPDAPSEPDDTMMEPVDDTPTIPTGPPDPAGDLPSGEVLFSEDFESDTDAWIPNTTTDWLLLDTADSMVYNQATVSNELRVAVAGDIAWTDRAVEAKVRVLSFGGSSTSYVAGVFARFQDLDNHYYAALRSDGRVAIRGRIAGSAMTFDAADVTTTTGVWYTLRFEVLGSTLTAFLDGVQVLTVTDASLANGGIGVGTVNAAAEFDDVVVTTL